MHTQVRPRDLALTLDAGKSRLGNINGYGKANILSLAGNGRIHANYLTANIHQWPTGVTGINSCIRLNQVIQRLNATPVAAITSRLNWPSQTGNNTLGS